MRTSGKARNPRKRVGEAGMGTADGRHLLAHHDAEISPLLLARPEGTLKSWSQQQFQMKPCDRRVSACHLPQNTYFGTLHIFVATVRRKGQLSSSLVYHACFMYPLNSQRIATIHICTAENKCLKIGHKLLPFPLPILHGFPFSRPFPWVSCFSTCPK